MAKGTELQINTVRGSSLASVVNSLDGLATVSQLQPLPHLPYGDNLLECSKDASKTVSVKCYIQSIILL